MFSFPERLAIARKKKGLTQQQLADIMGYKSGKQTQYNWEKGNSEPSVSQLVQLAKVLEISVTWLVTGVEADGAMPYVPPPDKVLIDASEAAELYRIKSQMLEQKLNQSGQ